MAPPQSRILYPRFVLVAAVALVAVATWWVWISVFAKQRLPSIAVARLENLSGDAAQEYFSDGMSDALRTNLSRVHGLSVISRTSTMPYQHTKSSIAQMARELMADYVVEGTVERTGGRVRIGLQLTAEPSGRSVWAGSYERSSADLSTLEAELTRAIADQIHINVTPQEEARIGGRAVSAEAQDLYLRGRFDSQVRDPGRVRQSVAYFQQAIAREPEFALPYAGLGQAYSVLAEPADGCRAVKKALDMDDDLGEAHALIIACLDLWDWREREWHLRRATELSPSDAAAHQQLGVLLVDTGHGKDGVAEIRRAVELDPRALGPKHALCLSLYLARQFDQAVLKCVETQQAFPDRVDAYQWLGLAYSGRSLYPQAIAYLGKAVEMSGGGLPAAALLAHVRALAGDTSAARKLIQDSPGRADLPPVFAALYLDMGDKNGAFEVLNKAIDARSPGSDSIGVDPALDALHGDPRWPELRRKMKLQ